MDNCQKWGEIENGEKLNTPSPHSQFSPNVTLFINIIAFMIIIIIFIEMKSFSFCIKSDKEHKTFRISYQTSKHFRKGANFPLISS